MKIGVCGTGRMGSSIAQRLMSVGHEVGVWNRTVAKTQPLSDAGAKLFTSPAELVEGCEAVIVMLLNDAATEAVYRGASGILNSKLIGKLVIDRSRADYPSWRITTEVPRICEATAVHTAPVAANALCRRGGGPSTRRAAKLIVAAGISFLVM